MAIRVIQKATVDCDYCGEKLAKAILTRQLLEVFETESKFVTIRCLDCIKEFGEILKERK